MKKSLQKSANRLCKLHLDHPGILDYAEFSRHFLLSCYQPSRDLQPFVTHVFTQRVKNPRPGYRPIEVLSGPNIYLFFTSQGAYVHTITPGVFDYNLQDKVVAGVKFRPGGFRTFFKRPLSELQPQRLPLSEVIPGADSLLADTFFEQPDEEIVAQIEALLRTKNPAYNRNIERIEKVLAVLENEEITTVEQLAQAVGKSERSLQLLFRDHVGVGLKWIIARQRLLRAVHHSHATQSTWAQASLEVGYSTQSHFSNDFKKVVGMSPSDFIKSVQVSEPRL